jgi:hypothetical protein
LGRNPRFSPDPRRAHPHEAGASVLLLQPSVHDRIGAVGILGPFMIQGRWAEHYEEAMSSFAEFEEIEARLVALPLDQDGSGIRSTGDTTFVSDVYRAGTRAVLSAILALQHLTAEIELVMKVSLDSQDLGTRLQIAMRSIGFASHATVTGFDSVPELERIRHAIEHPTAANLYSHDWDKVPIAWMFSDRPLKVATLYGQFFDTFAEAWVEYLKNNPRDAVTWQGIQRGIGSAVPYKKPSQQPDVES